MYEHLHPVWLLVGAIGSVVLTFVVLLILVALHPNEEAPAGARRRFKHAEITALSACFLGVGAAVADSAFLDTAHNSSTWLLAGVGVLFCLQLLSLVLLAAWALRLAGGDIQVLRGRRYLTRRCRSFAHGSAGHPSCNDALA